MIPWSQLDPLVLAVAALTLALLGALALWWRARTRIARANRWRQRGARVGEEAAEQLLGDAGFRVLDRQVTTTWTMWVDGEPVEVRCRADLLVEQRRTRSRYVAEVKTGSRAPDPTNPQTRRQLLEYRLAFDVDGVLLVDMEARCVRTVSFPGQR